MNRKVSDSFFLRLFNQCIQQVEAIHFRFQFIANLNYYRSKLRPDTKMVCMVKASAYGAGSYEIAKTLQEHHVDYLAVAVADEGSELRKAGITASIIIMNPEMTAFKTMFDYKLEPAP